MPTPMTESFHHHCVSCHFFPYGAFQTLQTLVDSAKGAAAGTRAQLAASAVAGVELPSHARQAASLGNFPSAIPLTQPYSPVPMGTGAHRFVGNLRS